MVQFDEKTELRLQEKIIDIVERIQGISRLLLFMLAATVVLALPLAYVLRYALFSVLYTPTSIILYQPPHPEDIKILEKKVLPAGRGTYFAFARISNPNADLAVRALPFEFQLIASTGAVLASYAGESYLMPGQDKLVHMPVQQLTTSPERVELVIKPFQWSRVGKFKNLIFPFQGASWRTDAARQFLLSAEIKNENPYLIPRLELTAILYNIRHEVLSVNFTTIDQLRPEEIRFFGLVWPQGVADTVVSVDFKASVNQLESGSVIPLEAPPDPREFRLRP